MFGLPKNDLEYSQMRLDRIMTRRRLNFNPYKVSDERLMEIVTTTGWGNEWDITQLVTVHFTRLQEVSDWRRFLGVYMTVADSDEEIFIPLGALIYTIAANDCARPERSWVGKRPIRNAEDVKKLVGHSYFVSRIIPGTNIFMNSKSAYRFHLLKGNLAKDAAMIREAICAAKIEMLERILTYPRAHHYLSCDKGFFDYETRIRRAIERIKHFPEIIPPKE